MAKKKKKKQNKKKKTMNIETATPVEPIKKKRKSSNYIDNEKMYKEMVDYTQRIAEYNKQIQNLSETDPRPSKPKVSEYIGSCIIMIAQRLATKPNFANYVHREEMIGDGIENCLMYIDNFDPNKSKNPFAYFTQIIYFAFVRRIQKEKKQMYTKMKLLEKLDNKGNVRRMMRENSLQADATNNIYADYFNLKESDIKFFEKRGNNQNGTKKKCKKSNLDEYFDFL